MASMCCGRCRAEDSESAGLAAHDWFADHYARAGDDSIGAVFSRLADAEPAVSEAIVRGLRQGWHSKYTSTG